MKGAYGKCSNLSKWAKQLGLDVARFKRDSRDPALRELVLEHQREATRLQVRGTPAFFINGRFLSGAQPIDAFSTLVDQELATARAAVSNGTPPSNIYDALMRDAMPPPG